MASLTTSWADAADEEESQQSPTTKEKSTTKLNPNAELPTELAKKLNLTTSNDSNKNKESNGNTNNNQNSKNTTGTFFKKKRPEKGQQL